MSRLHNQNICLFQRLFCGAISPSALCPRVVQQLLGVPPDSMQWPTTCESLGNGIGLVADTYCLPGLQLFDEAVV